MGEVGIQELIMNGLKDFESYAPEVDIKEEEDDEEEYEEYADPNFDDEDADPNFDEVMESIENSG